MINILYLLYPESNHDPKWSNWFEKHEGYNCYYISRGIHDSETYYNNPNFLGTIDDYSVFKPWKNKKSKKLLNNIIQQKQIDIFHIFYADPNALWAKEAENVKICLTTHGSDVLVGIKKLKESSKFSHKTILKIFNRSLARVDAVFSSSSAQLEILDEYLSKNCRMAVIRTGIDVQLTKILPKKKIIFFPRFMEPVYNHEEAIRAIELLPADVISKFTFIFKGRNGSNRGYIQKIQEQLDATGISSIQFVDDMSTEEYFNSLAEAELVVMTPVSDGSPVSAMETLVSGTKLILPDLNYDRDIFRLAYFYESGNTQDLADKIVETLNAEVNEEEFLQMKEDFNMNKQMEQLAQVYKELAQAK